MALFEYVKDLKTALAREDGDQLQQCLSIDPNIIPGGQRLLTTTFTNADVEAVCSGAVPVIRSLAKEMLLYVQAWKAGDGRTSFLHFRGAYRIFVEDNALLGGRGGQSGWLLPTLESMSRDVRTLGNEIARDDEEAQADVTSSLHTAFSQCLRDRSQHPDESKKRLAMHMAVVLYKHCFRVNNLQMVKNISQVVKTNGGSLPRNSADSVASLYFEGLLLMRSAIGSEFNARTMQTQRASAERMLTQAFKECHRDAMGNRKRILANLVPLRMRMGCLPERSLLEKYDLVIFDDFSNAIRRGDLRGFSDLMKQHKRTLELNDLSVHMEDCRLILYRQILKKIVAAVGLNQIPLSVVRRGFVLRGHEFDTGCEAFGFDSAVRLGGSMSVESQAVYEEDQLKVILTNLLEQGVIKGAIKDTENALWLKKGPTAFPDLPGRGERVPRSSSRLRQQHQHQQAQRSQLPPGSVFGMVR